MRNEIRASIVSVALAIAPLSGLKADDFGAENKLWWWNNVKSELYNNLNKENLNTIELQWSKEIESLFPIDAKIVTNAALSYFDEEVKLYSLKWEAREKVWTILLDYLSVHPILRQNSNWEILFIIDNKPAFASMIKELANTLFDWMPKFIRDVAVLIAFGWNDELQKTLNNLDYTVMNLPTKQFRDIVFDYFAWIVKRVALSINWNISVREYYRKVHEYYPNKNHDKILKELSKTWQIDDDIVVLKYPFKKAE